jgi:hypothetical protein
LRRDGDFQDRRGGPGGRGGAGAGRSAAADAATDRLFAARLDLGLERRLYPHSALNAQGLALRVSMHRHTLLASRRGGRFSMGDLARMDAELAREGQPGLYDEVVGRAGQPQGPWKAERLNVDTLTDRLRGRLLAEVRQGHAPLEVAAGMGLLNEVAILQLSGGVFYSVRVGEALPVDRSVQGRPVLQRADPAYATLIDRHLHEALAGPTLYLLDGGSIVYERLAVPGRDGLVLTLPFNRQVAPGLKIA